MIDDYDDYTDNYIEPPETCEWLWLGHLCGIEDPEQMCSECPNLTEEEKQWRSECVQELRAAWDSLKDAPAELEKFIHQLCQRRNSNG